MPLTQTLLEFPCPMWVHNLIASSQKNPKYFHKFTLFGHQGEKYVSSESLNLNYQSLKEAIHFGYSGKIGICP